MNRRLLVVTGGHRVELGPFLAMVDAVCADRGWVWAHAVQPTAQGWLRPEHAGAWDAVLLHDMPGWKLGRGMEPEVVGPDRATREAVAALLDAGVGLVVAHHALAAWPGWDGWAHAIGGRFLYAPGTLDGRAWPTSGYRMDRHGVRVLDASHPVCAGVDAEFEVDDELYLCPILTDEVHPLLATTADLDGRRFISTFDEVAYGITDRDCAHHPAGSPLVGWAKVAGRSPVVYLQPGHGPETMIHPAYRRLLANAIDWVASAEARAWADANPAPVAVD